MKIWIDGAVVSRDEAKVSVLDHGFLYGDGVFEGIRGYGGRIFRLEDHLRRLAAGARALALEIPGGIEAARRVILETARAHGEPDVYVRLVVSRGVGELGVDPTTCPEARLVCIAAAIRIFPPEKLAEGISLATSSLRRPGCIGSKPPGVRWWSRRCRRLAATMCTFCCRWRLARSIRNMAARARCTTSSCCPTWRLLRR